MSRQKRGFPFGKAHSEHCKLLVAAKLCEGSHLYSLVQVTRSFSVGLFSSDLDALSSSIKSFFFSFNITTPVNNSHTLFSPQFITELNCLHKG